MSAIDDIIVDDDPVSKTSLRDYLRPYTIVVQYNGELPASTDLLRMVMPVAVEFAATLPGTYGRALVAPTADTTLTIKKNGSSIGTLVFEAGSPTTVLITFASTVTFAAGDLLQITSPGSPDATLADVSITLLGKH